MSRFVSAAVAARILESRPDGTGVVDVPILRVGQAPFDGEDWVVTPDTLRQFVSNFERGRGLIVGVGPSPHRSFGERGGPQAAFVKSLRIDGDVLMAAIDIALPKLFRQVTGKGLRDEDGGVFVAYSVEALPHEGMPGQLQAQYKFDGWVLVGGVFTNRPVFDTVYQIAAETVSVKRFHSEFRPPADKESVMSDPDLTVKLATAEASLESKGKQLETARADIASKVSELKAKDERIAQLETEVDSARSRESEAKQAKERLSADLDEERRKSTQLEVTLADERKKRVSLETENTGREVMRLVRAAIKSGVAPSGFGEYEKDPAAWLNTRFRSLEAFQEFITGLPKTASMERLRTREATQEDNEPVMDEARRKSARDLGLDPRFVGVTNAAEAQERVANPAK